MARIDVNIETKSHVSEKALESILDNEKLYNELMVQISDTVRKFIDESGVMGKKPYTVSAHEDTLQRNFRRKVR